MIILMSQFYYLKHRVVTALRENNLRGEEIYDISEYFLNICII